MAKKRGNSNKYFLRVDGTIIDFSDLELFPDMTDYLNLSLFTGQFGDKDCLISGLRQLDLFSEKEYELIDIVKKGGAKGPITFVTSDLMLKGAVELCSVGSVKEFLTRNRSHYDALCEFFSRYHDDIEKLIDIFESKVCDLGEDLKYCTNDTGRAKIGREMDAKRNSLRNFYSQRVNIQELIGLTRLFSQSADVFDRELELEYIVRLGQFVDNEAFYLRKDNSTPNKRGLVKLAVKIWNLHLQYPELELPRPTNKNDEARREISLATETVILEIHRARFGPCVPLTPYDESIDPDTFMFLEEEDYRSLIGEHSSKEEVDSVENSILSLNENKRKMGG